MRFEELRGLVEPGGIGERDMQEAGAGRRLQLAARALGDLLALVDDGDAGGELVGLVEILRGEQDGDAGIGERRGSCARRPAAHSDRGRSSARRGRARPASRPARRRCRACAACRRNRPSPACAAASERSKAASSSSARAFAARPRKPQRRASSRRFSRPVRSSSSEANWPVMAIAARTSCGAATRSWPMTRRRPRIRRGQRREHAHQRRLAGAVRAENGEDHAARHVEVDAVDGAHLAEALDEAARRDGRRRLPFRGRPARRSCVIFMAMSYPVVPVRPGWRSESASKR